MADDVNFESSRLSTIERLILAQAVFEHGADDWQSVSKELSQHPALGRSNSFFSPQSCQQFYLHLMNEAALECSEANNPPRAPINLVLAQRHYTARLLHLRDLIAAGEAKFKCIVAEIDQIRSGAWDDKIRARLAANGDANTNTKEEELVSPTVVSPEPQAHNLVSADDQTTLTQVSEKLTSEEDDTTDVQPVEETTVQPPAEVLPNIPVDDEVATTPIVTEPQEPALADIPETEESETMVVDAPEPEPEPEPSQPVPETAQTAVEEPVILQEPEPQANEKPQQREGKRKAVDSDNLDESLREKKRLRDDSISTDIEEQPRQRNAPSVEPAPHHQTPPSIPNKRFQTVIGMLHSQISQHRNGNIFHNPIKNSEAPDYHDIIKRPMDLKTIKGRIKDGVISNSLEFQRDVYLMFANAMMYNRPSSDIYRMAEEMMAESEVHINTFRQTEGFIRSTRS